MSPALFLVLFLSVGQHGGRGATGCWSSCQKHVQDSALRSQVCKLCLTTGRVDSWVLELGRKRPVPEAALRSALGDPDWRVRWAAVRAQAKARGQTETRTLADWVAGATAKEEVLACVTAARVAAEAGRSTADFLKDAGSRGGEAATRVWARRNVIRAALEVEVYAEDRSLRGEALLHLAGLFGQSPARAVLLTMAERPESADEAPASALFSVAEKQGTSVGRMLVLEAKPADQALINRLFAVYSRELETLQKRLSSVDEAERRAAVVSLRRYGPLAQRELERALGDTETLVRRVAARGLAEAEGLSLSEAVSRRVRSEGASPATRRPWWEVVSTDNKVCEPFLLELANDTGLPPDARGEAVGWLTECEGVGRRRFQLLLPLLQDAQALVRAGAVRALAVPRSPEGDEAVAAALEDPSPEVTAAALDVVGQQRQLGQAETAVALLGSEHAGVREAAARALERIGRAQHVRPLAQTLQADPVASVRVAAAQSLTLLGGPFAASALSQAASKDPDSHVQHVARRGLERLGFSPPP